MNKTSVFLQTLKKNFGADPSCRFSEKRKNCLTATHSNSEK